MPTFKELMEKEGAVNVADKGKQPEPDSENKNQTTTPGQEETTPTTGENTNTNPEEGTTETEGKKEDGAEGKTQKPEEGTAETESKTQKSEEGAKEEGSQGEPPKLEEKDVVGFLNSSLETQFQSVSDIKELLDTKNQYQNVQSKIQQYENAIKEKDQLIEQIGNPYANFPEQLVVTNELINKAPELKANPQLAMEIASSDFDKMDDDDVLVLAEKRNNPKLSNSGREELLDGINDEYGLYDFEEEEEELTERQKQRLKARQSRKHKDAEIAREELKQLADIKPPEQKNREEQIRQQRDEKAKQLAPVTEKMVKDLDKVEVQIKGRDSFEYQIDDGFKNWLMSNKDKEGNEYNYNFLTQYLVDNYNPDDPNSYDQCMSELKQLYYWQNLSKINSDLVKSVETRMQEQHDKEDHNAKGKNYQERVTETERDKKNREQEEKALNRVRGG